ncbi:alpha/beta hydrolase-fold protein [Microbulbifer sp. MLAF003]|uniref:alpha/beta hydrolase n=1 Tax=Microbulbifer TaxID=48073 RepID=UPI00036D063F|nr:MULTISPECIES: alpha/beta hydrolase-fold protein [Microbulbifer]WHI51548.1 alpha/beta hydrolase-fold protein [Microbulbifer sp. MLAF003]
MLPSLRILLALLCYLTFTFFSKAFAEAQLASGTLETLPSISYEGIADRPVQVWLPDEYPAQAPYAVLYMHDGQMLFDSRTTWNGQEWGVDETASRLIAEGRTRPFIVVALHNSGDGRHGDYFPQKARDLMSESSRRVKHPFNRAELRADRYLEFLVKRVKPYIDTNYKVSRNPENTFIAGSSMGGLISLYAVLEYPQVFSATAAISTHWPGIGPEETLPVAESIRKYLRENLPEPGKHRFYFDHGTETLDRFYPPLQQAVDKIMRKRGYNDNNWQSRVFVEHTHDEKSWNARLDHALIFLLGTEKQRDYQ